MTIIVGVKCTDGVVIGADSVATSSHGPHRLIQIISDDKINIVGGKVIIACSGAVGLSQRFQGTVATAWQQKSFQKPIAECLRDITRDTVQDFERTGVPAILHSKEVWGLARSWPAQSAASRK